MNEKESKKERQGINNIILDLIILINKNLILEKFQLLI